MLIRRIIKEKTGKEIFRAFFRDLWPFAVFAFFGMMDTVRYLLARTLSSSRLQEGMEGYEEAVSGFFSAPDIWISAFLRTIGHSISGITWQTGSLNLLEGPAFYTGISVMLAAPAALWCMKGKQKATYLVLVFGAACYIAIVPLRLIASGFAKETFKLSSFWIVIAMLLFAADIFRRAKKHELRRGTMAVLMISALAMIGLLIFSRASGYVASVNEWWISLAFVILYLILGTLFCTGTRTGLIRLLAILCVIAEAALVPFEMVHNREMESADENSMKERAATKEIIAALPGDEWYRMEKDYVNVFQSDSLAEGYKGSSSYLGGIEINQSVLDIYQEFTLPQRSNHYLFGSGGNIYFEATEACRYLLAKNNFEFRYGYELKGERNGIKIYENLYAHPFVYYSKDLTDPETLRGEYESSDKVGYEVRSNAVRFGLLPENTVLIIEAEFDHQSRCTLYMEDRNNRFSSVYFMGSRHMVFEIANPEIQSMWFDTNTRKRLKDIHFYAVDQEEYYQAFRERSAEAQKNAVQIRSEGENHFTGEVQAEEDGYIITAIPYDKKWVICLDEKILDTMVVNGGFLGAEIPKGEYQLQIRYAGDSWLTGNLFKILGFGAFIFAAVMIKLQNKNRKERIS